MVVRTTLFILFGLLAQTHWVISLFGLVFRSAFR